MKLITAELLQEKHQEIIYKLLGYRIKKTLPRKDAIMIGNRFSRYYKQHNFFSAEYIKTWTLNINCGYVVFTDPKVRINAPNSRVILGDRMQPDQIQNEIRTGKIVKMTEPKQLEGIECYLWRASYDVPSATPIKDPVFDLVPMGFSFDDAVVIGDLDQKDISCPKWFSALDSKISGDKICINNKIVLFDYFEDVGNNKSSQRALFHYKVTFQGTILFLCSMLEPVRMKGSELDVVHFARYTYSFTPIRIVPLYKKLNRLVFHRVRRGSNLETFSMYNNIVHGMENTAPIIIVDITSTKFSFKSTMFDALMKLEKIKVIDSDTLGNYITWKLTGIVPIGYVGDNWDFDYFSTARGESQFALVADNILKDKTIEDKMGVFGEAYRIMITNPIYGVRQFRYDSLQACGDAKMVCYLTHCELENLYGTGGELVFQLLSRFYTMITAHDADPVDIFLQSFYAKNVNNATHSFYWPQVLEACQTLNVRVSETVNEEGQRANLGN